jgi:hypothetical protein
MTTLVAQSSYHLSWPLGIWLTIVVLAFFYSTLNVNDAIRDLKYLKKSGLNGFRKIIARNTLITEISRLISQILFLILGLQALFAPWVVRNFGPHDFAVGFDVELIVAVLLVGFNSFLTRLTRNALIEYDDKQEHDG